MAFFVLLLADILATIYNVGSKKLPGMDFFVAGAVFLLCIYGSSVVSFSLAPLAFVIACIGFTQVLVMNMVNGGLKDVDHDAKGKGKTLAIALGVKVEWWELKITRAFKACAYSVVVFHIFLIL